MPARPKHQNTRLDGGGFHHVAINTPVFDESLRFYCDVLGCAPAMTFDTKNGRGALLDTGDGNYIEIFEVPTVKTPVAEGAITHLCFRCRDIDGITERVRAAGFKITVEPKSLTLSRTTTGPAEQVPIRIAFFEGPTGESVEVFASEHL